MKTKGSETAAVRPMADFRAKASGPASGSGLAESNPNMYSSTAIWTGR
jgi:hypothetical protein